MNKIIGAVIGIGLGIWFFVWGGNHLASLVPATNEWASLIKVGVWFVWAWLAGGITFVISAILGFIVALILGGGKA